LKPLFRKWARAGWLQRAAGFAAAEFLRLVWWTNRFGYDPPDIYERVERTCRSSSRSGTASTS